MNNIDKNKYIPMFCEIGQIMFNNHTDTVELELSTPKGTVIFEVTMRLKEEEQNESK